jgi:RNA polymerase sigma-70 factor, ECF subfamily
MSEREQLDRSMDVDLDHQLMERLHGGDRDAATLIYVRYAERLLSVARRNTPADLQARFDPEDVVQSVFRTFFRRAASGAYAVPEGEELWKLFLVIALNKIRRLGTFHRADKRNVTKTSPLDSPAVEKEQPLAEESLRLLEMAIDEILAKCPQHARQMVRLRIEGCDVAEIAGRTERSKRSVERVLQNFRALLKGELVEVDLAAREEPG